MTLPLYFDHNVDRAITEGLRARGIDVLTAREDGFDTRPDPDVFQRATDLGRVAVSNDEDFLAIAHAWQREGHLFAGLIRARQEGISVGVVIEDIEIIATLMEPHDLANHIEYVPFPHAQ